MTNCKGCDARDKLIATLAKEIDRLHAKYETTTAQRRPRTADDRTMLARLKTMLIRIGRVRLS